MIMGNLLGLFVQPTPPEKGNEFQQERHKTRRFERLEDDVSFSTPGWWGWGGSTISSSENVFMSCLIMNISRSQQVTADGVSFENLPYQSA